MKSWTDDDKHQNPDVTPLHFKGTLEQENELSARCLNLYISTTSR